MNDTPGSEMPRSEIDDLLGAYALDAVDADERELVERHLAGDPAARAEVDEMRETAAVLASLPVADEGAPADLWDRIAGAIADPLPPPTTRKRQRNRRRPTWCRSRDRSGTLRSRCASRFRSPPRPR